MSGGQKRIRQDLPYCDPWLEKKYKLFKFLFQLGLKKTCGKSGQGGVWTHVW